MELTETLITEIKSMDGGGSQSLDVIIIILQYVSSATLDMSINLSMQQFL